ncbi:MAG: alpha/beta fold hydrolase [Myxococcales bacterium]|nr:alpha/beta fold hydrolase [Myxococcales bacterium]
MRRELRFPSGDTTCAADLYVPEHRDARTPCVVMAHGFTGTRDLGLASYATRFAAAGLFALVFDYRHFGTSGGEPRQVISVTEQLDDWRAAIAFARGLPEVDPDAIAIWGTSLSGGHVVAIAAEDPGLAAVVAQVPWLGVDRARESPWRGTTLRALAGAAIRDRLRAARKRPALVLPVVGEPGELAVFTGADAAAFARRFAATAPTWRNEIAARSLLALLRYRPREGAARIGMPLLLCVAEHDRYASPELARRVAAAAPRGELRTYPIEHFDAYLGENERLVADQVAFRSEALARGASRSSRKNAARS